eukprot:10203508-Prorocentrum_lima.AAC.1
MLSSLLPFLVTDSQSVVVLTQPDMFPLFTLHEGILLSLPTCHQSMFSLMPEPFMPTQDLLNLLHNFKT